MLFRGGALTVQRKVRIGRASAWHFAHDLVEGHELKVVCAASARESLDRMGKRRCCLRAGGTGENQMCVVAARRRTLPSSPTDHHQPPRPRCLEHNLTLNLSSDGDKARLVRDAPSKHMYTGKLLNGRNTSNRIRRRCEGEEGDLRQLQPRFRSLT